jgi:hypothetical protein
MDSSYNKISLLVYFVSFFFPVFAHSDIYGFHAFFIGFSFGYLGEPVLFVPWVGNFVFFASLLCKVGGDRRLLLTIFSVIMAGSVVFVDFHSTYITGKGEPSPRLNLGYILWLSSFTINLIGTIRDRNALKKRKTIWG